MNSEKAISQRYTYRSEQFNIFISAYASASSTYDEKKHFKVEIFKERMCILFIFLGSCVFFRETHRKIIMQAHVLYFNALNQVH